MLLPGVQPLRPQDFPRLVEVWEASVRATHDFLAEEDILAYRRIVQAGLSQLKNLLGVRGPDQEVVGFMAVEGNKLEMLFVHPDWRRAGVGRRLVGCAVSELGVRAVDVNEQNAQAVGVMDLYQATFPEAKNLFSYRDAVGFVASFYRIFKQVGFPEYEPVDEWCDYFGQILNRDLSPLTAYLDEGAVEASFPQRLALWWLAGMEGYLAQCERGISALAVRYDDLNWQREEVVRAVFEYCGLPTSSAQAALKVFERDPQAGTFLGREDPSVGNRLRLTEAQVGEILAILGQHPVINTPDYMLPGTLTV
jgi:putative acetyltransferase